MMIIQEYLSKASMSIVDFLERCLPEAIGKEWWTTAVIEKLSEHQSKIVEEKGFSSLKDFDLAALLNILERNWRAISELDTELDYRRGLNLIIELKNIRNHYAHEPSTGTELDQQIRDIDSITRLLKIIRASSIIIEQGETLHRSFMIRFLEKKDNKAVKLDLAIDEKSAKNVGNEINAIGDLVDLQEEESQGLPVHWLKAGTILEPDLLKKIGTSTYVGIDFGTSTSVVSIAVIGSDGQALGTKALEIKQYDELGREIHSHLVDTCLAWFKNKLLFGVGASALKQELAANQSIWSSFKMGLGVDLGPEYNRTNLPKGRYEYTIEKPQQATAVFLKLLCNGIKEFIEEHNLPSSIFYTVTVPASFEANQRKDLFKALEFAGIKETEIRLMDEPNAAFLSYLIDMESRSSEGRFVDILQSKKRNILVFDFGAGTCDISILEVGVSRESILSRNIGISRFWALGGDDIDKIIAEKVLLPQLTGGDMLAKYLFTSTQLEQQVLPHLKPVAEALKIACCELAEHRAWISLEDLKRSKDKITTKPSKPFEINKQQWQINQPEIELKQFAEIMALFVGKHSKFKDKTEMIDVLQPIDNALEKVEMSKDDIDMVLFIGGSCENPIIRNYVSNHLGRFVECITPRDLRTHVSQGAALYTLLTRGANVDPIKPITSETIYVLTIGEMLEPVIRAGALVPSKGILQDRLTVQRDGQKIIDLPFFSGSVNKPMGMIQIKSPRGKHGFKRGDKVTIEWSISKEKILKVVSKVGTLCETAEFHNPLANKETTKELLLMLKAKQAFNQSVLEGNGRPKVNVTLAYSKAARNAGFWRLSAEMLEAVERLDSHSDHATSICYCYSMDGDRKNTLKWAEIAYNRKQTDVTAYNLALERKITDSNSDRFEQLMQECLEYNPKYTSALAVYGHFLLGIGDARGAEYLQQAYDIFKNKYDSGELDVNDINSFRKVASDLGKKDIVRLMDDLKVIEKRTGKEKSIIHNNLVGSSSFTCFK